MPRCSRASRSGPCVILFALTWLTTIVGLAACQPSSAPTAEVKCAGVEHAPKEVLIPAGRVNRHGGVFQAEESYLEGGETKAFLIDATEVTNQQFAAFVAATGYVTTAERLGPGGVREGGAVFDRATAEWRLDRDADWRHPTGKGSSIEGLDRYPVVQVSLADAEAFARWTGSRLPTELEWERAARLDAAPSGEREGEAFSTDGKPTANTWQGIFPFVDAGKDGFEGTAPVGCFTSNGAGLYDMVGNVWEWTRDWYGAAAHPRNEEDAARSEPDRIAKFVIKGGSHLCAPNYCARYRSRARQGGDPGLGTSHIGFRTVRDVTS